MLVLLCIYCIGCKTTVNSIAKGHIQIEDSLMHIVKVDSFNKPILSDFFEGVIFKECNLSINQLKAIERLIYRGLSKDSLWNRNQLFMDFNLLERQYIFIRYQSKLCLYIKYVLLAENKKYYKLESMWTTHMTFIANAGIKNYSILYDVEQNRILNRTELFIN